MRKEDFKSDGLRGKGAMLVSDRPQSRPPIEIMQHNTSCNNLSNPNSDATFLQLWFLVYRIGA
jgi:hypothetical protein